ncbi:MAG: nicotinate (nicotinamide) nucleotide adenylyltransferase [Clostridia bacterium]|nr:nicotinate (nicotinamide) nucleotide adenylyltransferase [Clostridia bacterium]
MRIGIYGGAFNPVHKGHIKLAEEVKTKAHLDKIIIMPSGVSPHKSSGGLVDSEYRLQMCRLAFEGEDYIISDLEIKREGKSYTVDTVTELKKLYPDDELYLIMGSDMLLSFHRWYRYDDILSAVTICATTRQGDISLDELKAYSRDVLKKDTLIIDFEPFECSSTKVREALLSADDATSMLSEKVLGYIKEKGLYTDKYTEIRKLLKSKLDDYRYIHSSGVADSARDLAKIYGGNEEKAYFAGLLHDIAKNMPKDEQLRLIEKGGITLTDAEKNNPALWHAIAGECYLRCEMGITDPEILGSVRYHTTGKAGMSLMEKIIYIADYISAERNYPDVNVMRDLSLNHSLEKASLYSLIYTFNKQTKLQGIIHPDSVEYYNELLMKGVTLND